MKRQINVFIASSVSDEKLKRDRLALGDMVRRLCDEYLAEGFYIRLHLCEDESIAVAEARKQEEYNQMIRDSQIVLVLFSNTVGEFTLEELDEAQKQYAETGAPAITVAFRQCEAPDGSVSDLRAKLDRGAYPGARAVD